MIDSLLKGVFHADVTSVCEVKPSEKPGAFAGAIGTFAKRGRRDPPRSGRLRAGGEAQQAWGVWAQQAVSAVSSP